MQIRFASSADAYGMSQVLKSLAAAGKRRKRSDPEFTRLHYITHPDQIRCTVAFDGEYGIIGFQSLKLAAASNPYGTPSGWGIIGTHILPDVARRGVGRLLFPSTLNAARSAGIPAIEAFIGAGNQAAIAYYEAMGFATYRRVEGVDCKRLSVS